MTPNEMRNLIDSMPYSDSHRLLLGALVDHVERLDAAQPPGLTLRRPIIGGLVDYGPVLWKDGPRLMQGLQAIAAALDINTPANVTVDALVEDYIIPAIQGNTAKLDELSLKLAEAESKIRIADERIVDLDAECDRLRREREAARDAFYDQHERRLKAVRRLQEICKLAMEANDGS